MRIVDLVITTALVVPGLCLAVPASAQQGAGDGRPGYSGDFFAHSQPANAFDMVALLPGFRLVEGDSALRGYSGAAGNVLVDGQRPAGKAETLEDVLKRIPAARVARIELVRSGTPGVDMQGYALLANVVLASGSKLGGRLEAEQAIYRHGFSAPRVSGQLDFDRGGHIVNLSAAAYREVDDEHGFGTRHRLGADGTPLRLADYFQPEVERIVEGTASYRLPFLGGTLRLNGLARDNRKTVDIGYDIRVPEPAIIRGSERKLVKTYETGLRFERPLGAASSFDLIASYRAEREKGVDSEVSESGSDQSDELARTSEAIMRAAFRHNRGRLALELGAEGAINRLDSRNLLFEDGVGIPLPNAEVDVAEHRAEFFANTTWDLSSSVTLESGLRYEVSRLVQSGDTRLAKSLAFLKPRARLSWSPAEGRELRLLGEREVGQLDFGNFVGAASLNAGTISAGNRDLEPDSLWRAEIAYEHRLGTGSLVLAVRREWISDLVDQLPVVVDGNVYDAVGNIGSARRDEVEASLKFPLDRLGLRGVLINADVTARRSQAVDPSTGERRRISRDIPIEAKLSLTHDIPVWKLRWGATYAFAQEESSHKIGDVQTDRLGGRLDLFVEYKPDVRWTLRLFGRNLTDSAAIRTRDIYAGVRGSSSFRYSDIRTLRSGPYIGLNIQRSFGG